VLNVLEFAAPGGAQRRAHGTVRGRKEKQLQQLRQQQQQQQQLYYQHHHYRGPTQLQEEGEWGGQQKHYLLPPTPAELARANAADAANAAASGSHSGGGGGGGGSPLRALRPLRLAPWGWFDRRTGEVELQLPRDQDGLSLGTTQFRGRLVSRQGAPWLEGRERTGTAAEAHQDDDALDEEGGAGAGGREREQGQPCSLRLVETPSAKTVGAIHALLLSRMPASSAPSAPAPQGGPHGVGTATGLLLPPGYVPLAPPPPTLRVPPPSVPPPPPSSMPLPAHARRVPLPPPRASRVPPPPPPPSRARVM
jgi:hypothetical protein